LAERSQIERETLKLSRPLAGGTDDGMRCVLGHLLTKFMIATATVAVGVCVALMKRRRDPGTQRRQGRSSGGRKQLGAGPRRGAARWRGTAKKLNAKSRRLHDGP